MLQFYVNMFILSFLHEFSYMTECLFFNSSVHVGKVIGEKLATTSHQTLTPEIIKTLFRMYNPAQLQTIITNAISSSVGIPLIGSYIGRMVFDRINGLMDNGLRQVDEMIHENFVGPVSQYFANRFTEISTPLISVGGRFVGGCIGERCAERFVEGGRFRLRDLFISGIDRNFPHFFLTINSLEQAIDIRSQAKFYQEIDILRQKINFGRTELSTCGGVGGFLWNYTVAPVADTFYSLAEWSAWGGLTYDRYISGEGFDRLRYGAVPDAMSLVNTLRGVLNHYGQEMGYENSKRIKGKTVRLGIADDLYQSYWHKLSTGNLYERPSVSDHLRLPCSRNEMRDFEREISQLAAQENLPSGRLLLDNTFPELLGPTPDPSHSAAAAAAVTSEK